MHKMMFVRIPSIDGEGVDLISSRGLRSQKRGDSLDVIGTPLELKDFLVSYYTGDLIPVRERLKGMREWMGPLPKKPQGRGITQGDLETNLVKSHEIESPRVGSIIDKLG
jgi:hypothetical protein